MWNALATGTLYIGYMALESGDLTAISGALILGIMYLACDSAVN